MLSFARNAYKGNLKLLYIYATLTLPRSVNEPYSGKRRKVKILEKNIYVPGVSSS